MSKLNLVTCRAMKFDDGYDRFRLRPDAAGLYLRFLAEMENRGGIITSAGSFRSLEAPGGAARSLYSLHKIGLALDLDTDDMGMTSDDSPYRVSLDDGTGRWTVWCLSTSNHPDVREIQTHLVRWRLGKVARELATICAFDFSALARECGFVHIRPRKAWPKKYLAGEAHHLQASGLLAKGTTFLAEALKIDYAADKVLHALPDAGRAKWDGRAFT